VRQAFFEDLKKLHERSGPWDLLIFTGDLTSSGDREEFVKLEQAVLQRIFDELRSLGSGDAKLLAVPGNHDVSRPNAEKPTAALRQLLREGGFQEIADEFWVDRENEYRKIVTSAFRKLPTVVEHNGIPIGLVH
jgi:predicted MPP superfamily phosphohydrolase